MNSLTAQLKEKGVQTLIETSGAYKLSGEWDWICLSPKKMKLPTEEVYEKAHELKCIIYIKTTLSLPKNKRQKQIKSAFYTYNLSGVSAIK